MMLSEVEFVFFFPAVVLLHWLLPRKAGWQNGFLLLASYIFYLTWNAKLIPLLLLATLVDYAVGRYLGAHPPVDGLPPDQARRRRLALGASLVWNLGTLAFFKYAGFFAESFNALMTSAGLPSSLPVLRLILPLGLSYYTLQKLGYVINVYYGRQEPCRSLLDFALYTAFFPQMIAGPISRASALLPQLQAPRRLDPDRVRSAALTFLVGFAGKAYIADFLGRTVVDPVFANPDAFSVAGHWLGLVGYAMQVFCDFGGYSFMALAAARFVGIELPVNFTLIVVLGGDGTMLRAIREHWRRRVPFYGINTGHMGFLLNDAAADQLHRPRAVSGADAAVVGRDRRPATATSTRPWRSTTPGSSVPTARRPGFR